MSDVSIALYKYLNENFGTLDWRLGSVIRELVAEPIVKLTEEAVANASAQYNKINIAAMVLNPEVYAANIDELFNELGLSTPTPTVSSGLVQILTTSSKSFTIPAGTTFTYNNYTLRVTDTYTATTVPATTNDLGITQIGADAFAVEVPVTSVDTGITLGKGAELSWSKLDTPAYSAVVSSAITGGIGAYTATQKINLIRQMMFPAVATCSGGVLRTINRHFPNMAVDCVFATKQRLDGVGIYVKTVSAPEYWSVDKTIDSASTTVTIDGTGIYAVVAVNGDAPKSVVRQGRSLIISCSEASDFVIEVYGLKDLPRVQAWLDTFTRNTGITLNVLTPKLLDMSMYLRLSGDPLNSTSVNAIVAAVNNSLQNVTALGDAAIQSIVTAQNNSLAGAGTYTLKSFEGTTTSALSNIDTSPFNSGDEPFAIYTAVNSISTNNA